MALFGGLAETAKLAVDLSISGNFKSALAANQKALSGFDAQVGRTGTRAFRAGQQIGTGIRSGAYIAAAALGFLATNVGLGLHSLSLLDDVVTQSNAVLKSTKGIAGETAQSIRDLANKYEDLNATIDDTVIQSGENLLLTFTNIRKQAFEPTLQAALDMNQALGGGEAGLNNTIRILGKALNDPLKGLTALQRVGVRFTDDQKKQIATALKAGDTFKAQSVILDELNKRFGGSFLAGGTTTTGKVAKFKDAIDDLQRALATALLPAIGKVSDRLSAFLKDPKVIKTVSDLGQAIAGLFSDKNLAEGGKVLGTLFDTAKAAAPVLKAAASSMLEVVKAAVGLFRSLPEGMQQLAVGAFAVNKLTGGLVTNIAGGLAGQILQRGSSPANPLWVASVGGGLAGAAGGAGIIGKVGSLVTKVAIVGIAAEVASLLAGPVQQLGGDIHTAIFGDKGDPLSDFGKAWTDWRKNADWPFGQKNAPEWAGGSGGSGSSAAGGAGLGGSIAGIGGVAALARAITGHGTTTLGGAIDRVAKSLADVIRTMTHEFGDAVRALVKARKPEDVQKSVAAVLALVIGKSRGSAGATEAVLADLRKQLGHTHDAKTAAILRSAIHQVEAKIPGRVYAQKQIDAVTAMLSDGKLTTAELRKIKGIEQALKDHGLPSAAKKIEDRVNAAKDKIAQQTSVLRHKKFNPTIKVTVPITNNTSVTLRDIIKTTTTFTRLGGFGKPGA